MMFLAIHVYMVFTILKAGLAYFHIDLFSTELRRVAAGGIFVAIAILVISPVAYLAERFSPFLLGKSKSTRVQ
jgi:hypothetical protein